jgi:hypothetical protein
MVVVVMPFRMPFRFAKWLVATDFRRMSSQYGHTRAGTLEAMRLIADLCERRSGLASELARVRH